MPEVEDEVNFNVGIDGIQFRTRANGDHIRIICACIPKEAAAALAYLINKKVVLAVQIKEEGT